MRLNARVPENAIAFLSSFLVFPEPGILLGEGSSLKIAPLFKERGKLSPFLFVDPSFSSSPLLGKLLSALSEEGLTPHVDFPAAGEPDVPMVNDAYGKAMKAGADSYIALGGGSTMDLTKAVMILHAYEGKKDLSSFAGLLRVHRKLPFSLFIPTTAGTGSEITPCAVVSSHHGSPKKAIMSYRLVPSYAVLDPLYLASLPEKAAAYGVLDALSHAVESYLNRPGDPLVASNARMAVHAILGEGAAFVHDRRDNERNLRLLRASYQAGRAFSKGYVGYAHALSHALGGSHGLPHGFLNAVLLPIVLASYGRKAHPSLAELEATLESSFASPREGAERFLTRLKRLNEALGIPVSLDLELSAEEVNRLARLARKEANWLYHVPVVFNEEELGRILLTALKRT